MLSFEEYEKAGRLPVSEWVKGLSPGNQQKTEQFLKVTRHGEFRHPHFKKYQTKKRDPDLYEARWKGMESVPHRIFCYPNGTVQVILLCGFTKKGTKEHQPRGAYDHAIQRRKEIEKGEATTHEFTLGEIERQGT